MFSVILGYILISATCPLVFIVAIWSTQDMKCVKILYNSGVTEGQVLLVCCTFWPISVPLLIVFVAGYAFYSLYVVIRAVIAIVKVKIKNA